MKKKLGKDKILKFRRSWDTKPDPLSRNNPYHPLNIETYKKIPVGRKFQMQSHLRILMKE